MTIAEHRAKCIKAMKLRAAEYYGDRDGLEFFERLMTLAFDSLHDIARVNPIEATEEMIEAAWSARYAAADWRAMSSAGRLTKPPEKKP